MSSEMSSLLALDPKLLVLAVLLLQLGVDEEMSNGIVAIFLVSKIVGFILECC